MPTSLILFTLSGTGTDGDLTVESGGILGLQLGANGITLANQSTSFYAAPGILNSSYTNTGNRVVSANDRIVVADTLSLTSGSIVEVSLDGYTPALGDAFDLLDWASLTLGITAFNAGPSTRTGTTADNALYDLKLPDITAVNSDYLWDTSLFVSHGILVVVPEPSTVLLFVMGLIPCLLKRRRA